eukprot:snap_masked-scaffold_75-processed-gene-0.43-mRNA-1 protein AED:1.00 eAED:1.00 QI:0/0/0/0/1/1/2/0/60
MKLNTIQRIISWPHPIVVTGIIITMCVSFCKCCVWVFLHVKSRRFLFVSWSYVLKVDFVI